MALSAEQQSAYDLQREILAKYGLESLAGKLRDFIVQGLQGPSLDLALRNTNEYKQRFIGNEARIKAGLPALEPAEYIAMEAGYKTALANYGLPAGFYDSPDDFAGWMGKDVSPAEVARRAQLAYDKTQTADPAYKQALKDYYGIGDAEVMAFFLDGKKAQPILEKQAQALEIGAAARRNKLDVGLAQAQDLVDNFGVDQAQAQQGFGAIGEMMPDARKLADIDKVDYSVDDAIGEVFKSDGTAAKKRKGLASRERARFGGSAGANRTSLTQSDSGQY